MNGRVFGMNGKGVPKIVTGWLLLLTGFGDLIE